MTFEDRAFPRPVKLTVDSFMALHERGAFAGLSKVELIEGELLTLSPQHVLHARAKTELAFRLRDALRAMNSVLELLIEATVLLSDENAPEPDIVIADRVTETDLVPLGAVKLLVEIADSSLARDVGDKARLYARHGVPEYWVVAIPDRTIEQFSAPSGGAFTDRIAVPFGQPIKSITIPGLEIDTAGLA